MAAADDEAAGEGLLGKVEVDKGPARPGRQRGGAADDGGLARVDIGRQRRAAAPEDRPPPLCAAAARRAAGSPWSPGDDVLTSAPRPPLGSRCPCSCLLYPADAADEEERLEPGGRCIHRKKKT